MTKTSYTQVLTDWSHISAQSMFGLMIAMFVLYILIFVVSGRIEVKLNWYFTRACAIPCLSARSKECPDIMKKLRGDTYYVVDTKDDPSSCILTMYEVSHFFFHMFMGYYYNIYISQFLSVSFEYYEYMQFGCHSYIDLGLNLAGALIGALIRYKHQLT
jgi:hypothetical protein